jgi:hypothetical protein
MPNRDRTIGTDKKTPLGVDRMQTPAHVVDVCAVTSEGVGLEIDVAEIDQAGSGRLDKPTTLP